MGFFLGGNCPGGNHLGGNFSGGSFHVTFILEGKTRKKIVKAVL